MGKSSDLDGQLALGAGQPTAKMTFELPLCGAPGRIRTCDARFRKPTLYPLSYEGGAVEDVGEGVLSAVLGSIATGAE